MKRLKDNTSIWRKFDNFQTSLDENNESYNFWFNYMQNIYFSLFEWRDLPDSMDARFLEYILMYKSGISVFEDEIGLINLPFIPTSQFTIYQNPDNIAAYSSVTGFYRELTRNEYVIVWANDARIPPILGIEYFAAQMYEIDRTIQVNIKGQKTPKVIQCSESQRLSIDNFMKNVEGNVPYIPVKETMDIGKLQVLDMTVPYVSDKLDVHLNMVWNRFLTWCGIENANNDKRERLVQSEVNSNYGNVEMSRNTGLKSRQKACEEINQKFGTNITVSFNSNIPTLLNEGFSDGNLYNNVI